MKLVPGQQWCEGDGSHEWHGPEDVVVSAGATIDWKIASGGEIGGYVNEICRKKSEDIVSSQEKWMSYLPILFDWYHVNCLSAWNSSNIWDFFILVAVGLSVNTQLMEISSVIEKLCIIDDLQYMITRDNYMMLYMYHMGMSENGVYPQL